MFTVFFKCLTDLMTTCHSRNGFQVLQTFLLGRPGRERPLQSHLELGLYSMSGLSHWLWVKQSPKGFPPIRRLQVGRRGHGVGLAAKRINKFRKPGIHLSSVELRLLECDLEAVSPHQWCGMTVASGTQPLLSTGASASLHGTRKLICVMQ